MSNKMVSLVNAVFILTGTEAIGPWEATAEVWDILMQSGIAYDGTYMGGNEESPDDAIDAVCEATDTDRDVLLAAYMAVQS